MKGSLAIICFFIILNMRLNITDGDSYNSHPNVILILGDDLGYGDLSLFPFNKMGISSPEIEILAANGLLMTKYDSTFLIFCFDDCVQFSFSSTCVYTSTCIYSYRPFPLEAWHILDLWKRATGSRVVQQMLLL